MANYDKNFLAMMGGHLNIFGDNGEVKIGSGVTQSRTPLDNTADIRDILTNIVGNSYKGITDEYIRKDYARLANMIGITQAQKLIDQAIIYNQRADVKGLSIEQKVNGFYTMGSQDKTLDGILQNAAKFGDGPIGGMRRSRDRANMNLVGNDVFQAAEPNEEFIKVAQNKIR